MSSTVGFLSFEMNVYVWTYLRNLLLKNE